ncbi:MAG TPA: hypothetical protein P5077_12500 [bacterium]|nr:hypothetical protein [bacterium]
MTKGFYRFMCMATAAVMSIIGCGPESDPPLEYGPGPTDYDQYQTDEYEDALLYADPYTEYDDDLVQPDTDEPVISDDPPMEYGPIQTDYDGLVADYDGIIEQPDEMTTDYGPVSRSFKKK